MQINVPELAKQCARTSKKPDPICFLKPDPPIKEWVGQDWFLFNEVNLTAVLNPSGPDHQENMSVKCIPP